METKILHYIATKYILLAVGLTMAKNDESLDSPSKILSENPDLKLFNQFHMWGELAGVILNMI